MVDVQAIINSTVTPNMTFTKTSHKFGQWADSRANTVYGLGFSTEQQLQQVRATRTPCVKSHPVSKLGPGVFLSATSRLLPLRCSLPTSSRR